MKRASVYIAILLMTALAVLVRFFRMSLQANSFRLLPILAILCAMVARAGDVVRRDIVADNDRLWVEDRFDLGKQNATRDGRVLEVYLAAQRGTGAKLTGLVKGLLIGDDLELIDFTAAFTNSRVDLRVTSRLKQGWAGRSRLRWVPNWLACSPQLGPCLPAKRGLELEVLSAGGGRVLRFPSLGESDDPVGEVSSAVALDYYAAEHQSLRFECTLRACGTTETLFAWDLSRRLTNAPGADLARGLGPKGKMPRNDMYQLFTNMKPAKAGYYCLCPSGFTNAPPPETMLTNRPVWEMEVKPRTSLRIDGSFEDWASFATAWKAAPASRGSGIASDLHFVEILECLYTSDEHYLYLFFKFSPPVDQRYTGRSQDGGHICFLYLDGDFGWKAESTREAVLAAPEIAGTDTKISIGFGTCVSVGSGTESAGLCTMYEIARWDPDIFDYDFSASSRRERSVDKPVLIKQGRDGVEMALLLSDLGKGRGDKFDLVFQDDAGGRSRWHRVKITLK
jgi:hypothetical protein